MVNKFFIEGTLPGLNEFIGAMNHNRFAGAKLKKETEARILSAIKRAKVSPTGNLVSLSIEWVEKSRRRDKDNVAAAKKFILDALVTAGVLQGDGWKHVHGFTDTFSVNKDAPGVWVTLIEMNSN